MATRITRRDFVKDAALASAATLGLTAHDLPATDAKPEANPGASPKGQLPMGRIGKHEFTRLMLGGNLVAGYSHSRDLRYVSQLMKQYNTEAKIIQTLEVAESYGINAINLAVWDDISYLQKHWKNGGKIKLIAQALLREDDKLTDYQKAVELGAAAVHMQGHGAEKLVIEGRVDLIGKTLAYLKKQGVAAGVGAHALKVIEECEKAKLDVDFYQKTLHTWDYKSAPKGREEVDRCDLGTWDNSWCAFPEEVVDFMGGVKKPWVAFKVMAAGAIPPRQGFQYAFENGADFVLAGMFDWQIAEDVKIAQEVLSNLKRTRAWMA